MLSKNKIFYLLSLVKNMPFYHRVNYHLMKILLDFYLVTSIIIRDIILSEVFVFLYEKKSLV